MSVVCPSQGDVGDIGPTGPIGDPGPKVHVPAVLAKSFFVLYSCFFAHINIIYNVRGVVKISGTTHSNFLSSLIKNQLCIHFIHI